MKTKPIEYHKDAHPLVVENTKKGLATFFEADDGVEAYLYASPINANHPYSFSTNGLHPASFDWQPVEEPEPKVGDLGVFWDDDCETTVFGCYDGLTGKEDYPIFCKRSNKHEKFQYFRPVKDLEELRYLIETPIRKWNR